MIQTEILPNGLRIVADQRLGDVVYCGLAVDAGTRDELPTESGMAHFTEHMSFKGTEHRRAWHIINRMEAVGGELNAYTGKEHTVYYCSTLRRHLHRAIDLLTDIVLHSTYPQHEMDREVEVVIDEIESYNDSPAELIYDDFEAMLYQGHPLGRNILGTADNLRQFRTADMQRYVSRLYHPARMVLYVYGNVDMKQILRALPHSLLSEQETTPTTVERIPPSASENTETVVEKEKSHHQAHVIIGAKGYSPNDPRYICLYLLNNILGGPGMNARLNVSLRERAGLVYTVESSMTGYTDTGLWTTYFGCDHKDVDRCRRMVERELHHLTDTSLTESQLNAAKRQLKGQIALSWENGENVAIAMGCRMLHGGGTQTQAQLCECIDSITAQQLQDVAQQTFAPSHLHTLIYK